MSANIPASAISEHRIQFKFRADKVPTGDTDDKYHNSYENAPRFTHDGKEWEAGVSRGRHGLDVYLMETAKQETTQHIKFGVRIVNGDMGLSWEKSLKSFRYAGSYSPCFLSVISWEVLIAEYCVNGEFTVEFIFPVDLPVDYSNIHTSPMTLESAVFKDIVVVCGDGEDDDGVECNKCIVARESQVMFAAFNNATSKESLENKFVIGHDCATPENVRLFVRAMYEGYIRDLMDPHAGELLQLSHMYECPALFVQVVGALKRLLTDATFWSTVRLATLLDEGGRELLVACAQYAKEPKILYALLKRGDHSTESVSALMMEIAERHSE